jgi:hypothetical protein
MKYNINRFYKYFRKKVIYLREQKARKTFGNLHGFGCKFDLSRLYTSYLYPIVEK